MRKPHTAKTRSRIAHGLRRFHARRRALAHVLPRSIAALVTSGQVHHSVRGFLDAALSRAAQFEQELGGKLSAVQTHLLGEWVKRQTAADAAWARFLTGGAVETLERSTSHASAAARLLELLKLTPDESEPGDAGRADYRAALEAMKRQGDRPGSSRGVMTPAPVSPTAGRGGRNQMSSSVLDAEV